MSFRPFFRGGRGSFRGREDIGYHPREDIGYHPREDVGYHPREDVGFRTRDDAGFHVREEVGFRPRPNVGYRARDEIGFHAEDDGSFPAHEDIGFSAREGIFRGREEGSFQVRDETFHHEDAGIHEGTFRRREETGFARRSERGFGHVGRFPTSRGTGFATQPRPLLKNPSPGLLGRSPDQGVPTSTQGTRPFRGSRGGRFQRPPRGPWRGGPRPSFSLRDQDYKSPERTSATKDEPPVKKPREDPPESKPKADAKKPDETLKPKPLIPEPVSKTAEKEAKTQPVKSDTKLPQKTEVKVKATNDKTPVAEEKKVTAPQVQKTPSQVPKTPQVTKTPEPPKPSQEKEKKTPQGEKNVPKQEKAPSVPKPEQEKKSQESKQQASTIPSKQAEAKKTDQKFGTQDRERSSTRDKDNRDRNRDSRDHRDNRDKDRRGRDDRKRDGGRDSRDYKDSRSRDYNFSRDSSRNRNNSRDRDYKRSIDAPSTETRKKLESRDEKSPSTQGRFSRPERDWNDRGLDEPEIDPAAVCLDFYNSDLNLKLDKDCFAAQSITEPNGFCFCWGGVRATYGITKGKVCYEVRILEHLPVDFGPDHKENDPHVVRIGWSTDATSFQLGEEADSYGYGGTGKISHNSKFQDYGQRFSKGDVIIAMLDLVAKPPNMSFAKNGRWLGVAYPLRNWPVGEHKKALFPHILSKNCRFEVNFGQREPFFRPPPGFTYVGKTPAAERVQGMQAPATKADCEMILVVGLPGAGKTTWASKFAQDNCKKRFNIIGTDTLIDKMKVMGLPRRRNYHGRWEVLIKYASDCLNKLFEIGSTRRRNYILDQTNVYDTARRRKLRYFAGFQRRCAVIQPTDAELERRSKKRTEDDGYLNVIEPECFSGKYVPDHAVLEMKKNYSLPSEEDPWVEEVIWIEHQRAAAQPLVEMYNKQGAKSNPNQSSNRMEEKQKNGDRQPLLKQRPDERSASLSRTEKPYQKDSIKEERSERTPWQRQQDDRLPPWQRDRRPTDRERSRSPLRRDFRGPPGQDRPPRQERDNSENRPPGNQSRPPSLLGKPDIRSQDRQPDIKEEHPWQQRESNQRESNRREPYRSDQPDRRATWERDRDSKERPWVRDGDRQAPWERNQADRLGRPNERDRFDGPRRSGPDNMGSDRFNRRGPGDSAWQRENHKQQGDAAGLGVKEETPWLQQESAQKPMWSHDQGQHDQRQPWQRDRSGGFADRGIPPFMEEVPGNIPPGITEDDLRDKIKEEPMDIDPDDMGHYGFDEQGRPLPPPSEDSHKTRGPVGRGRGLLSQPRGRGSRFGGPEPVPGDTSMNPHFIESELNPVAHGQPDRGSTAEYGNSAGRFGRGVPGLLVETREEGRRETYMGRSDGSFGQKGQYDDVNMFNQPYGRPRSEERWDSDRTQFDRSRPGANRGPFPGNRGEADRDYHENLNPDVMRGRFDKQEQQLDTGFPGHPVQTERIAFDQRGQQQRGRDQQEFMDRDTYDIPGQPEGGPFDRPGPLGKGPADRPELQETGSFGRSVSQERDRFVEQGSMEKGPYNVSQQFENSPFERPGPSERIPSNRLGEQREVRQPHGGSPFNRPVEGRERSPYDRFGQQQGREALNRYGNEADMNRDSREREQFGMHEEQSERFPDEFHRRQMGRNEPGRGLPREGPKRGMDRKFDQEPFPAYQGDRDPSIPRSSVERSETGQSPSGYMGKVPMEPSRDSYGDRRGKSFKEPYGQETWEGGYSHEEEYRDPNRDPYNRNRDAMRGPSGEEEYRDPNRDPYNRNRDAMRGPSGGPSHLDRGSFRMGHEQDRDTPGRAVRVGQETERDIPGRLGGDAYVEEQGRNMKGWVGGGTDGSVQEDKSGWGPRFSQNDQRDGHYVDKGPNPDIQGHEQRQSHYRERIEQGNARLPWSDEHENQKWAQRPEGRFRDQMETDQTQGRGYSRQTGEGGQQDYYSKGGDWGHHEIPFDKERASGHEQDNTRKSRWDTEKEPDIAQWSQYGTEVPSKQEQWLGLGNQEIGRDRAENEAARYGNDPWNQPKQSLSQVEDKTSQNVDPYASRYGWVGGGGDDTQNSAYKYGQSQQSQALRASHDKEAVGEAKEDVRQVSQGEKPPQLSGQDETPVSSLADSGWQSVLPNITIGPGVLKALSQLQPTMKLPSVGSDAVSSTIGTSWEKQSQGAGSWQYSQTATSVEGSRGQAGQTQAGGYGKLEGAWSQHSDPKDDLPTSAYGTANYQDSGAHWQRSRDMGQEGGHSNYPGTGASRWPPM